MPGRVIILFGRASFNSQYCCIQAAISYSQLVRVVHTLSPKIKQQKFGCNREHSASTVSHSSFKLLINLSRDPDLPSVASSGHCKSLMVSAILPRQSRPLHTDGSYCRHLSQPLGKPRPRKVPGGQMVVRDPGHSLGQACPTT